MGLMLIVSVAVLAVLFLVAIIQYKLLILLFVRMVKGRYSFAYVAVFKYFFKKSPGSVAIKDDVINHVHFFFVDGCARLQTKKRISFSDVEFFSSKKQLRKKLGKPHYFTAFLMGEKIGEVYGYSDTLFGEDVRCLYFFVDNTLFLGEYSFGENSELDASYVASGLQEKYTGKQTNIEGDCFLIEDHENRKLYFGDDGFSIRIIYFNAGNDALNEEIRDYIQGSSKKKSKHHSLDVEMERL